MFCSSMLVVTTRTKIEISTLCPQSMCFINIYKQTFIVNKTSRYKLKSYFIRKFRSIPQCSASAVPSADVLMYIVERRLR